MPESLRSKLREAKVPMVTASDRLAKAGYIEFSGGPRCGNCSWLKGQQCANPKVDHEVSPKDGCCNLWKNPDAKTWGSDA